MKDVKDPAEDRRNTWTESPLREIAKSQQRAGLQLIEEEEKQKPTWKNKVKSLPNIFTND